MAGSMCALFRELRRNKSAISPVIATVIIVAVTITVAIAVAYWMGGIAGLYTRFEQLEIVEAYAVKDEDSNCWRVVLKVMNKGSSPATIDGIYLNGVPFDQYQGGTDGTTPVSISYLKVEDGTTPPTKSSEATTSMPSEGITINPGDSEYIVIFIPIGAGSDGITLNSGVSVEIKLHTAAGKEYPRMLTLP